MTLLKRTMNLLSKSKLSTIDICNGANVKPRWLNRLKAGDFDDPGVNKVERIYKLLSKQ